MMEAADVIREARAVLFERGWAQQTLQAADGSLCLIGSLKHARYNLENPRHHVPMGMPTLRTAQQAVRAALPRGESVIEAWNDREGRTFDEVIAVLDRAEKIAEQEFAPPTPPAMLFADDA